VVPLEMPGRWNEGARPWLQRQPMQVVYGAPRAGPGAERGRDPGRPRSLLESRSAISHLSCENLIRVVEHHRAGDEVMQASAVAPGAHEDERNEQRDDAQDALNDAPDDLA
jgi:hypothetical protein